VFETSPSKLVAPPASRSRLPKLSPPDNQDGERHCPEGTLPSFEAVSGQTSRPSWPTAILSTRYSTASSRCFRRPLGVRLSLAGSDRPIGRPLTVPKNLTHDSRRGSRATPDIVTQNVYSSSLFSSGDPLLHSCLFGCQPRSEYATSFQDWGCWITKHQDAAPMLPVSNRYSSTAGGSPSFAGFHCFRIASKSLI